MDDVTIDGYKTTVNLLSLIQTVTHSAGLTQGTVGHSDLSARYQQPLCAQVVHNDQHTPKGCFFFFDHRHMQEHSTEAATKATLKK